jgi:hypothetical protein
MTASMTEHKLFNFSLHQMCNPAEQGQRHQLPIGGVHISTLTEAHQFLYLQQETQMKVQVENHLTSQPRIPALSRP